MRINHLCLVVLALTLGCGKSDRLDPAVEQLGRASGPVEKTNGKAALSHPPMSGNAPTSERTHQGRVLETMDASRYTYLQIETKEGQKLWAAVPQVKVSKGAEVHIAESLVMKDFESPTLKRTFPLIVFGILMDSPEKEGTVPSSVAKTSKDGGS
jgi:hypothetical protein